MSWTQHEIIKKHAVQRVCMAVGHLNLVSLFDWQQFWNEVVYLEHLYEEKRMEDWVMAIRGVRRPSGPCLNIKTVFPRYGDSMLKIRQSWDRLIFNMGISILVRQPLYIDTAPQSLCIFIELNVLDIFVSFFEFGVTCCMMHTCHMSSQIVANISGSSYTAFPCSSNSSVI